MRYKPKKVSEEKIYLYCKCLNMRYKPKKVREEKKCKLRIY